MQHFSLDAFDFKIGTGIIDYLSFTDREVIRYFKEVDNFPAEDKSSLLRVIGGFLRDVKTKQAYASGFYAYIIVFGTRIYINKENVLHNRIM